MVYKLCKILGSEHLSDRLIKCIRDFIRQEYLYNTLYYIACLVVDPFTVDSFVFLFNRTIIDQPHGTLCRQLFKAQHGTMVARSRLVSVFWSYPGMVVSFAPLPAILLNIILYNSEISCNWILFFTFSCSYQISTFSALHRM